MVVRSVVVGVEADEAVVARAPSEACASGGVGHRNAVRRAVEARVHAGEVVSVDDAEVGRVRLTRQAVEACRKVVRRGPHQRPRDRPEDAAPRVVEY